MTGRILDRDDAWSRATKPEWYTRPANGRLGDTTCTVSIPALRMQPSSVRNTQAAVPAVSPPERPPVHGCERDPAGLAVKAGRQVPAHRKRCAPQCQPAGF